MSYDIEGFRIEPLTPDRFDDLVAVLGKGGQRGCWCMYWLTPTTTQWREQTTGGANAENKAAMAAVVETGPPPGLIAYEGGAAVAWCRVMPRSLHPGLARSRTYSTELSEQGVWSLSCFVVRTPHRGRGLTSILTKAALEYARAGGASAVEVYPWDITERKDNATIYTGVASTFLRLGFAEVQRRSPERPMLRKVLDSDDGGAPGDAPPSF